MSEVRRKDAERKLLTLAILDGTIDRPTAADLVRCIDKLECRIDALEQRISDVNDAALYDRSQLEERLDALERRVDGNAEQIRKDWNAHFRHYGYLEERLTEVEKRIEAMERKLNHKGGGK